MKHVIFATILALGLLSGCKKESERSQQQPQQQPPEQAAPQRPVAVTPPTRPPVPAPTPAPPATAGREAPARPVELSQGTTINVRTIGAISTKTHKPGDTFTATLEEPLIIGNRTVAPRGATVQGRVVESDPGGRVEGRARLGVQLTAIEGSGGRQVEVATATVVREAPATKAKDAQKVGVGAGIGAIVGAVAGGGSGAAIGAAAGAGAGTAAVLATRGDPATIGSETVLTFRLREPVRIS